MNRFLVPVLLAVLLTAGFSMANETMATPPKASLLRVHVNSASEVVPLIQMHLDICSGSKADGYVDLLANATQKKQLLDMGYQMEVLTEDVSQHDALTDGKGYALFHTYDELRSEMQNLAATYPDICAFYDFGTTLQGRQMMACKVSDNVQTDEDEPVMFIVGNHHAREPMSVEVVFYDLKWFLENYASDPDVQTAVNGLEMWFVPMCNPDGHTYDGYAESGHEGWWRKNCRDVLGDGFDDWGNGDGDGIDLNRNFTYEWGYDDQGSSGDWWDQTYRGDSPASEAETQALINLIDQQGVCTALTYHSYGQYIIMPWGYNNTYPDEPYYSTFWEIADGIHDVLQTALGRNYHEGNCEHTVGYPSNGDFVDWMFGDRVKYGFCIEVNSSGDGGFYPDDSLIQPTCEGHFEAAKWLAQWTLDNMNAINITEFSAQPQAHQVKLTWRADATEGEDILGFNLYRKEMASANYSNFSSKQANDGYIKVNGALITGQNPYAYTDSDLKPNTRYDYKLEVVVANHNSTCAATSTETLSASSFGISSVYPLPADSSMSVKFTLDEPGEATINLYDLSGRLTAVALSGQLSAGEHQQVVETGGLASGIYILELRSDSASSTKQVVVSH
jgi:carboxypeptidase T